MTSTSARAKRLAAAASGEKAIKSYRLPDSFPHVVRVIVGMVLIGAVLLGIRWVTSEMRERHREQMIIADITQLCMQPVAIEDFADCYGDDCRLVYALAVSNQKWRDALVTQEQTLQRNCRIIRRWELGKPSSPVVIAAQANLPQ